MALEIGLNIKNPSGLVFFQCSGGAISQILSHDQSQYGPESSYHDTEVEEPVTKMMRACYLVIISTRRILLFGVTESWVCSGSHFAEGRPGAPQDAPVFR